MTQKDEICEEIPKFVFRKIISSFLSVCLDLGIKKNDSVRFGKRSYFGLKRNLREELWVKVVLANHSTAGRDYSKLSW